MCSVNVAVVLSDDVVGGVGFVLEVENLGATR